MISKSGSRFPRLRALVLTGRPELARLLSVLVDRELDGVDVEPVTDPSSLAAEMSRGGFAAAIVDVGLDWADAGAIAETVSSRYPDCVVIALGGEEARDWPIAALLAADDLIVGDVAGCLELPGRLQTLLAAAARRRREIADGPFGREAPVGLCSVAADGEVVDANRTAAELLGFDTVDALVGTQFQEFLDDVEGRAEWRRLLDTGGVLSGNESRLVVRGGGRRWVRLSAWPLAGGSSAGERVAVLMEDLAAAMATQERLSASLRHLERVHADFEHFTYALSHDLQQPLQLVARSARLLASDDSARDPEDERLVGQIVEAAGRMQEMLDGVLEYATVGERELAPETVDLAAVLEEAIEAVRDAVDATDARVTSEQLPLVEADREQMVRLFENLIANAIKYRGEENPRIHVSAVREGESWIVAVEDNGIGVPEDEHDRIFEMFQRLHAESEIPGTGVGLAVCQRIVERHGGEMWVRSTVGEGSTFYVRLADAAPRSDVRVGRTARQRGERNDARRDDGPAH